MDMLTYGNSEEYDTSRKVNIFKNLYVIGVPEGKDKELIKKKSVTNK